MVLYSNFDCFCHKNRHFQAKICISLAKRWCSIQDGVLIKSDAVLAQLRYVAGKLASMLTEYLMQYPRRCGALMKKALFCPFSCQNPTIIISFKLKHHKAPRVSSCLETEDFTYKSLRPPKTNR